MFMVSKTLQSFDIFAQLRGSDQIMQHETNSM